MSLSDIVDKLLKHLFSGTFHRKHQVNIRICKINFFLPLTFDNTQCTFRPLPFYVRHAPEKKNFQKKKRSFLYSVGLQDRCVVGCGRRVAAGVCGQCDGCGGVRAAGVWRLFMDQVDLMDLMDKMGAPRENPRVCSAAVWWGVGEELPKGSALLA